MSVHTKPKQYVKRVLLFLLILVIAFSVRSMLASALFYGIFFPRQDASPAYTMRCSDIDALAYPRRQIQFPSGGNMLTGYCYTCENPEALIVIASGFGESYETHLPETKYFVDSGFDVFCFDCTGVGESEGSGTVGLSQPAADLRNALDHIGSDPDLSDLPILLYGFSAGGYASATCIDRKNVRAAVILSGFESPTLLMRETARSYVSILADIEYPFLTLQNTLVFGSGAGESASEKLLRADIPIAVYEGADDPTVPEAVRLSSYLSTGDDPDITLTILDKPPRSGHSGLWLTAEAADYRASLTDTGIEPDISAANELDIDFMCEIVEFYQKAL